MRYKKRVDNLSTETNSLGSTSSNTFSSLGMIYQFDYRFILLISASNWFRSATA